MSGAQTHPSELDWAKHLSHERRWIASWRLRRHLASCATCRALDLDMVRERSAFDASPRRLEEVTLLKSRAATTSRRAASRARRLWPWIFGAAIAMALLAIVRTPPSAPDLVEKGRDSFTLYVDRPSGAVALDSWCAPGDRLIARYRSSRPYLLVVERDGRGAFQVLYPQDGTTSAPLPSAEGTTPTSWILDATAGHECFAAFFSDEPLAASAASRALSESPNAPALPGATVRVHCCRKGGAR